MGTDYVELMDKRTAELIVHGTDDDLIALVESRTRPITGPPVWRQYLDSDSDSVRQFGREVRIEDRFKTIRGRGITEVKEELIRELCTSDWLHLDYYGCNSEVFGDSGGQPPGATTWEDFIAPMFGGSTPEQVVRDDDGSILWVQTRGRYLLTGENVEAMIRSLRDNFVKLEVMGESEVARLERWHNFCKRRPDFTVVYQVDF